jgi:hypothetical protein
MLFNIQKPWFLFVIMFKVLNANEIKWICVEEKFRECLNNFISIEKQFISMFIELCARNLSSIIE